MTKFRDLISRMTRRHAQCRRSQRHLPAGSYAPLPSAREDGEQGVASGEGAGGDQGAELRACLTTLDLVSLGVGSCLGTGVYLTTGLVASTMAGPAGVVSLLVAGLVSILSGLCYAELAGLCPKTSGSAYMYAYITVGELAAFVIGWGLVVEYVIGTAAGAVALSETLDSLVNGHVSAVMGPVAAKIGLWRLDPVAAAICLLLTVLLASGVEMSARVNNLFNAINILVLVFFVFASLALGSFHNWVSVGFLPLGLTGVLHAIPTSYFAYIGFDTVATTGEEAKNPETSIPRSILLSVVINCLAYVTVLACLTFALPYNLLHHDTALTDLFPQLKFATGKYIIALGAVSGLFAATFGSMFPLPRVLSAMAADGLIFRSLGKICPKRRTPLRATVLSGVVAMVMATFVKLDLLIELVLIGTLLAYVLVAFAMLLMRYVRVDGQVSERRDAVRGTDNPSLQTHSDAENDADAGDEECKPSEAEVDSATFRRHSAQHCEPTMDAPRSARAGRNRANGRHCKMRASALRPSFLSGHKHPRLSSSSSSSEEFGENDATSLLARRSSSDVTSCTAARRISASSAETGSSAEDRNEHHGGGECQPRQEVCSSRSLRHKQSRKHENGAGGPGARSRVWNVLTHWADEIAASPSRTLTFLVSAYGVEIALCVMVAVFWDNVADRSGVVLGAVGLLAVVLIAMVGIMCLMPQTPKGDSFRAPCVPGLPMMVSLVNIFFITALSAMTWLLFAIWMALGLMLYMLYGIHQSGAGGVPHSVVAASGVSDVEDAADDSRRSSVQAINEADSVD